MNLTEFFIRRPVATILLTVGIALTGAAAYFVLPVASLPSVDFPTIRVNASLPGASPDVMATSVATPLERRLGAIADVTEMTSQSGTGSTSVTLQFGLNRNIDGAARDVQAAINASRADLPATLRSNPSYNKVNPAEQPLMVLNLTSPTLTNGQIYDAAATILQQKLSQVQGVGEVQIGGGSAPAVRVELNPNALTKYGISMEDVRAAIASSSANVPKGFIEKNGRRAQLYTNDQGKVAADYAPLVIAQRNGAPVRLSDVADVVDSVESLRNMGLVNGKPAVVVQIARQPGANVIATVDRIKAVLPQLRATLPKNVDLGISIDRTTTIRASLNEVKKTLLIAVMLVVVVVLVFLRNGRATLIPAVAVVVSLLGSLSIMYAMGFSLDNLSLMALTVATGFVVDDAIVVLENISRHVENGMPRFKAALLGAREVSFTVISMSISLVAVFIPILLMSGVVGRLFREFALTLVAAILFSLILSLTATPMMAARLIDEKKTKTSARPSFFSRISAWIERRYEDVLHTYEDSLRWALNHRPVILLLLLATIGLNVWLYLAIPKGFFPQQDTGALQGGLQVDQASSYALSSEKLMRMQQIVSSDPAVQTVTGFTQQSGGFMFIALKPREERGGVTGDQVIQRLRPKMQVVPGAQSFLQSVQDIRIGGRQSNAEYQYTLESDNVAELREWATRLAEQLKRYPQLTDVNTNQEERALETFVTVDKETAARLGVTPQAVDNALYNAFGQRQVATIYNPLNQYKVVMEVAPKYAQTPEALENVYVPTGGGTGPTTGAGIARTTTGGTGANAAQTGSALSTQVRSMVPLSAFAKYELSTTARGVNHQGQAVATTISFNLAPGSTLSDAQQTVRDAADAIGMPNSVIGRFRGTAQAFEQATKDEPILIAAALLAVYIVLGILYESYIHPITVISTLPSAGVGAVAALMVFKVEFSIIALIGVVLLIGIVMKNAIIIIDFALQAERDDGLSPRDSIYRACMLRFRPILMTTCAAVLGALPLAAGMGEGGELRRPLGIAIIGGLIASQMLTLLTTPVVYLYLDKLRRPRKRPSPQPPGRRRTGGGRGRSRSPERLRRKTRPMVPHSLRSAILVGAAAVSLSGCLVGPTYERPTAPVSAAFKEADGWKPSTPMDHIDRGAWWSIFNDPTLDALERRVETANQTLAASAATYAQAQAVSAEARATLFPTLTVNGSATRSGSGGGGSIITAGPGGTSVASGGGGRSSNRFNASAGASWAPDLWGRIRRTIEADTANAQGAAADLASARLSLQADLAADYFAIQALDEQKTLLDQTVAAYQRSVDLTQNRYDSGVVARADVISAEVQLQSAQAQAVDIAVQRAQLEHAIAVLVGTPPAGLTIAAGTLPKAVPTPPTIVPATLLERRPDIAGAERDMAAANAQIGVATAAYFPTLNLSGSYGFTSSALGGLFSASNSVWSVGPSLAETVLDFGARKARVQQTRAAYDQRVAVYRQTVLAAFQSVEDQLAALRVYQDEQVLREANMASANRAEELALNRYQAGQVDFTTVITAQTQALTARQNLLTIVRQRLTASVNLIEALGGGWTTADLPRG